MTAASIGEISSAGTPATPDTTAAGTAQASESASAHLASWSALLQMLGMAVAGSSAAGSSPIAAGASSTDAIVHGEVSATGGEAAGAESGSAAAMQTNAMQASAPDALLPLPDTTDQGVDRAAGTAARQTQPLRVTAETAATDSAKSAALASARKEEASSEAKTAADSAKSRSTAGRRSTQVQESSTEKAVPVETTVTATPVMAALPAVAEAARAAQTVATASLSVAADALTSVPAGTGADHAARTSAHMQFTNASQASGQASLSQSVASQSSAEPDVLAPIAATDDLSALAMPSHRANTNGTASVAESAQQQAHAAAASLANTANSETVPSANPAAAVPPDSQMDTPSVVSQDASVGASSTVQAAENHREQSARSKDDVTPLHAATANAASSSHASDATLPVAAPIQNSAVPGSATQALNDRSTASPITADATMAALDSGETSSRITWAHTGSQRAEAGMEDPVLGWVSVRAQAESGGVHASIVPVSQDAALSLGTHMAGLHAYLAERQAGVDSVQVAAPDSSLANFGAGTQNGQGDATDRDGSGQQAGSTPLWSGATAAGVSSAAQSPELACGSLLFAGDGSTGRTISVLA